MVGDWRRKQCGLRTPFMATRQHSSTYHATNATASLDSNKGGACCASRPKQPVNTRPVALSRYRHASGVWRLRAVVDPDACHACNYLALPSRWNEKQN
ncbi:hypothetical protein E2C01_065009 [Portunus trituberculatus]|uniref:Uncharacterized protein n=1 Tax=Portunus trituberculatus TaxID=210409 RepID=A0A5B7HDC3_PORTR|nr:hypothetical protein [Portunus trituberculatus]